MENGEWRSLRRLDYLPFTIYRQWLEYRPTIYDLLFTIYCFSGVNAGRTTSPTELDGV